MAKKQDAKRKRGKTSGKVRDIKASGKGIAKDLAKSAKAGERLTVATAAKSKELIAPVTARRKPGRPAKKDSVLTGITPSAKTSAKASGRKQSKGNGKGKSVSTSAKAAKVLIGAKDSAIGFFSDLKAPHFPTPNLPHVDIAKTAKDIGGQIMSVLNTPAGRVVAAEVLVYLATTLTRTASKTESGKDAAETVVNAGAKIAAAAASAGAKAMGSGAQAVEAVSTNRTVSAATDAAGAAATAVGGVVADVAEKVLRRRGRPPGAKTAKVEGLSAKSSAQAPSSGPSSARSVKMPTDTAAVTPPVSGETSVPLPATVRKGPVPPRVSPGRGRPARKSMAEEALPPRTARAPVATKSAEKPATSASDPLPPADSAA